MRRKFFIIALVIILLGIASWRYTKPLPALKPQVGSVQSPVSDAIKLPWPTYGQAALGATGLGVVATNNSSSPAPIASIAKAITALAVLKEKPLKAGEQGPTIILSSVDAQIYQDYLAKNGSVVPVKAGDQITEYQALEAMLLPSANNIADSTARWAFGSIDSYVTYANQFVKTLGMTQTTVATDASGFSPQTISTAKDLVLLGEAALKNPVLAAVVNQSEASFPNVGTIKNVNGLLGTDGILGIKTGDTDQAGGCFLFGAKRIIRGQSVTVIGAILGAPNRNQAMADSRTLIQAADKGFELATPVLLNQTVGRYNLPWGGSVAAATSGDAKILNWKGNPLTTRTNLNTLQAPVPQNSIVGLVQLTVGDSTKKVPVVLKQPITKPSLIWRILR
ncbi:MAG TPA: hypothetical protein VLE51_00020 [Candidatus Saccharimonadales bacterium]|nr:hypothetical protein [Candidatus Saccharimonadales bacterium]